MRIAKERSLTASTTVLRFSEREKSTLLAASKIAEEARRRCAEYVGGVAEWEGDPMDTELAHVEHGHIEVIDGVILDESYGFPFERA